MLVFHFSKVFSILLVLTDLLRHVSSVSAFTTSFAPLTPTCTTTTTTSSVCSMPPISTARAAGALRIRGGGVGVGGGSSSGGGASSSTTAMNAAAASVASTAASNKRIRIDAFDSMRFFLILNIVLGHFIMFANPSDFVFKFASQHNAAVGAFFALSGYVAAYTSTEIAQRQPSSKLTSMPTQKWVLSRIFGYYPLHLLVLLIFSPMFIYTDMTYNGLSRTIWNAILSVTLTQAWFPTSAEIWNAPTWYLSALNAITACMPFALVPISKMTKRHLRKAMFWLFAAYLLPKIGYWFDFNTLGLWEGITAPKVHPNYALFNVLRFNPLLLASEVLMGVVACRLVMLDNAVDEERAPKTNALSTFVPLALMVGGMYGRATGSIPPMSDLLFRSCWFVPLFLRFLMATHRNTVKGAKSDAVIKFLSQRWLVTLGNLSFPIYIVHGPIGQLFYKKIIATKLFGRVLKGPQNFVLYLFVTALSAWFLQRNFLQRRGVQQQSANAAHQLSEWF